MAVNATNVLVGAPDQATTGAILSAPLGTALPTSATDVLAGAFADSGYISEDGLALTPTRSTTDIKDWSGANVRRILESFDGTLAWAHLETSEAALKNYFGDDNVTITPATGVAGKKVVAKFGAVELPRKSWVFKVKDGDHRILIVVPDGQITETGEVTFTKTSALTWPVTLTAYPDANGFSIYVYTDDGVYASGVTLSSVAVTGDNTLVKNTTVQLAATATYSDSSTKDVTDLVTWASSDWTKATVVGGTVSGVAAGTTDITATLDSTTSTAFTVTVTAS